MFDLGWSELLVIATVAIVVVGPKDLPRMLRSFGKTFGQVRRTANDFKRQFNDALREAEREADLQDTRDQLKSLANADPLAGVKKDVEKSLKAPDAKPKTAAPAASEEKPAAGVHEAEPVKTGAAHHDHEAAGDNAERPGASRGTDAA